MTLWLIKFRDPVTHKHQWYRSHVNPTDQEIREAEDVVAVAVDNPVEIKIEKHRLGNSEVLDLDSRPAGAGWTSSPKPLPQGHRYVDQLGWCEQCGFAEEAHRWHPYVTTMALASDGRPAPCADCGQHERDRVHRYHEVHHAEIIEKHQTDPVKGS